MAVKTFCYFKKPVFLSSLICIFIFYSGLFKIPDRNKTRYLLKENEIKFISGKMLSSPAKISSGKYYSADFALEAVKDKNGITSSAKGRLKIYIPSEIAEAYSPGKLFSTAKNYRSKKNHSEVYLYESGGRYTFTGKSTPKGFYAENCTACEWTPDAKGRLQYLRALCRLHFKRLMYGWGSAGGLLLALLSGAREYTDAATQDNFRRAGLSHILALSGMHLSMFSAIAIFFGNRAGIKKLTFILRIIALICFVWFAGFSPSLLRAFICTMLTILAAIAGTKEPDMLSILSFSFLLQCAISPSDIHTTGFILSYGALAGILLTARFFTRFYSSFTPKSISASLSAATGAQTLTAPISLKLFGSFSPIGILSATIVSPFITVFIYSGLLLIILSLIFPVLAKASGIFINLQYTVIKSIVKIFSLVPNWSIT